MCGELIKKSVRHIQIGEIFHVPNKIIIHTTYIRN